MPDTPFGPVDYTARDFMSYREALLDAMTTRVPEWTSRAPTDFGIIMVEAFAWLADNLSFYGDRIANESFLQTAVQRRSVLNIARMLDYTPNNGAAATVTLQFTVPANIGTLTIPQCTQVQTPAGGDEPSVVFELDADLVIDTASVQVATATATEGEVVQNEQLGSSTGRPDQTFTLSQTPVVGNVEVRVNEGSGLTLWRQVEHFLDADGPEAVYMIREDDYGNVNVLFSDDVNGKIPVVGSSITATYRVGGGLRGNVPANTLTELVNTITDSGGNAVAVTVTNPNPANGGADPESLAEIRRNAPRAMRAMHRAISESDYADLALRVPGVARATSDYTGMTGSQVNIELRIAPTNGGAPSAALQTAVADYLDGKHQLNANVTVAGPTYVPINITVTLAVKDNYDAARVQRAVEIALTNLFQWSRVDFGQRVSLRQIYATLNAVAGVDYVVVDHLSRTEEGLGDILLAYDEIPSAGTITVTVV